MKTDKRSSTLRKALKSSDISTIRQVVGSSVLPGLAIPLIEQALTEDEKSFIASLPDVLDLAILSMEELVQLEKILTKPVFTQHSKQ